MKIRRTKRARVVNFASKNQRKGLIKMREERVRDTRPLKVSLLLHFLRI
jgi:hypothetical protein